MKLKITFPILKSYSSEQYALIIEDSTGLIHYWIEDGSYDGYSHDPCIDGESGTNNN